MILLYTIIAIPIALGVIVGFFILEDIMRVAEERKLSSRFDIKPRDLFKFKKRQLKWKHRK
jgi:hypothetical protein